MGPEPRWDPGLPGAGPGPTARPCTLAMPYSNKTEICPHLSSASREMFQMFFLGKTKLLECRPTAAHPASPQHSHVAQLQLQQWLVTLKATTKLLVNIAFFLTSAKQLKISYIFTINTKVSQGWSMLICNWCMNVSLHNKNESRQLWLPTYSDKFLDHINTLWHFYSCSIYYLSCTDLCSVNIHTHKHPLFFFLF